MTSDRSWWLLLPKPIRRFPADLTAMIVLTVFTGLAVFLPGVRDTPLRILFGLPFVLFVPGYAFVAALFPERGNSPTHDKEVVDKDHGIDAIERVALAFGLSIAIVPLLGLLLTFTPWGIRLAPIVLSVGGFTIGAAIVAALRRWELSAEERFSVPYRAWLTAGRTEVFEPKDRVDAALTVALALSIVLALGSVGFAVAVPQDGEQFTEFYLLTENDGELVADDYPEEFVQGEPQSVIVGIENNEYETVDYTVVIQLERVEDDGEESEVVERNELDRFETTLGHKETSYEEYSVAPTMTGDELRLTFLLYDEEVPEEPTSENAYRDLHLWIDVE